jgi:ABC-type glycerol-3-phosphate transport system substrate-binding protein
MSPIRKIIAVAVLACLAAACASGGSQGQKLSGSGTGTVVVALPSDNPADIRLRTAQGKAFMKANPDVTVKILTIPGQNYDQKVLTMIAGGKPPDISGRATYRSPTSSRSTTRSTSRRSSSRRSTTSGTSRRRSSAA